MKLPLSSFRVRETPRSTKGEATKREKGVPMWNWREILAERSSRLQAAPKTMKEN
jgi:hypothetical protein